MNNGMKLWFDVESSFMLNHPKIWYMKIQALKSDNNSIC